MPYQEIKGVEDCLYLNVYTPMPVKDAAEGDSSKREEEGDAQVFDFVEHFITLEVFSK